MNASAALLKTHFAVLLFGLSGPLAVFIGLPALELSMGRSLIAALALFLYIKPVLSAFQSGLRRHWLSGLLLAFHWFGFFFSTLEGSVAWGLLSFATYPFWTILIRHLAQPSWPGPREIISVLLIVLGTFLLVYQDVGTLGLSAILIGLASSAAFAVLQMRNSKSMQNESSLDVAAYQMLWAGLLLTPFCSFQSFHLEGMQWTLFLIHGILITAFSYTLFLNGLHTIGERKASYIAALEPVYGLLIASLLIGVLPSVVQCIAAVCILTPSFLKTE